MQLSGEASGSEQVSSAWPSPPTAAASAKRSLEPCRQTAVLVHKQTLNSRGNKKALAAASGGRAKLGRVFAPTNTHLGEDAEHDEPAGAGDAGPAGRAPRERDDAVVLREGGVGHAGHQGRQEAGDSVAQETATDPLQDFWKEGERGGGGGRGVSFVEDKPGTNRTIPMYEGQILIVAANTYHDHHITLGRWWCKQLKKKPKFPP